MTRPCVTHHQACDCREARFRELEAENERLASRLDETQKQLIERNGQMAAANVRISELMALSSQGSEVAHRLIRENEAYQTALAQIAMFVEQQQISVENRIIPGGNDEGQVTREVTKGMVDRDDDGGKRHDRAADKGASVVERQVTKEPEHPEDDCDACGAPNITWSAPSRIWNAVMGGPNGILCPQCFDQRAAAHGFIGLWRFEPAPE